MPDRRQGHPFGKLKAAARRWAGGRGGGAIPADDPLTQAAPLPRRARTRSEEDIELCPDEADAAALFFALNTQWRRHPMSGTRLGLDYAAIEPTARMLEIKMTPQLLTDLRDMEGAALDTWAAASWGARA